MSEDSEDIIKKLTEDVPDGKATFPADEDDEFNLLLDNFIQSELKNIEEEKNNTRIMLEEPEPQPIKQNASDDEVADALELAEQKLYTAYRNYVELNPGDCRCPRPGSPGFPHQGAGSVSALYPEPRQPDQH